MSDGVRQVNKKSLVQQGWLRALLYLILGLVANIAITVVYNLLITGNIKGNENKLPANPLEFLMVYSINSIGLVIVAFLMRILVDKKSILSLGFQWKGFGDRAWSGLFIAILILCIGSMILMAMQSIYFIGFAFDISNLFISALLFIVVALIEEIIFRGYLLNNLMDSMNKWLALAITSLVFALLHSTNPNINVLSVINIFIGGVLLGINYIHSKNLWFGIFLHFAWNFFQGPVFGYEVSGLAVPGILQQNLKGPDLWTGGSFGFEGSLLAPLLEIAAILLLAKKYNRANN